MPNTIEIHQMICLSSAHLTPATRVYLDACCDDADASDFIVYEKPGFGWFIPVDANLEHYGYEQPTHIQDLAEALRYAYRHSADWLMVDADGPVTGELTAYADDFGEDAMQCYGYLATEHFRYLPTPTALALFRLGKPVYRLYPDDSEGLVEDEDDIREHADNGGLFGIQYIDID